MASSRQFSKAAKDRPWCCCMGPGAYGAQWIRTIPCAGRHASRDRARSARPRRVGISSMARPRPSVSPAGSTISSSARARRRRCSSAIPWAVPSRCEFAAAESGTPAGRRWCWSTRWVSRRFSRHQRSAPRCRHSCTRRPTHTHDGLWGQCVYDLEGVKRRLGEQWQWIKAYNLAAMRAGAHAALMRVDGAVWIPRDAAATVLERIDADHADLGTA